MTVTEREDGQEMLGGPLVAPTMTHLYAGTYALLEVAPGTDPEAERLWLCRVKLGWPRHHRTKRHPNRCMPCEDGLCPDGLTGLLPGHDACGMVWVVREVPQ